MRRLGTIVIFLIAPAISFCASAFVGARQRVSMAHERQEQAVEAVRIALADPQLSPSRLEEVCWTSLGWGE